MEYNDEKEPSLQIYEQMARAYLASAQNVENLKRRFDYEEEKMLGCECCNLLFSIENMLLRQKNRAFFKLIRLTNEQREALEKKYNHVSRGISTSKYSLISLEYDLAVKLLHLASKSHDFDEIFSYILQRRDFYCN